jgi:hypothetical protein
MRSGSVVMRGNLIPTEYVSHALPVSRTSDLGPRTSDQRLWAKAFERGRGLLATGRHHRVMPSAGGVPSGRCGGHLPLHS